MKKFLLFSILFTIIFTQFSFNSKENETSKNSCKKRGIANAEGKTYLTENVVILVIDGPRYSETFGDPNYTLIPKMGKELTKEGVLYTNFRNEGVTHTTPGHTAILTGRYQKITNGGKELPKRPSMFQYFLKSSGVDKEKVWLISSKGKLEVLANCKNKKWWNTYMPSSYCGTNGNSTDYVGDAQTWGKIQQVFRNNTPRLTLINLLAVDATAHSKDLEGYRNGLIACDDYAFKIWNLIQSDPKMKDKTSLFITNDHGRHLDGHKDGYISHGDGCDGCRHISLLAMGPDFKKNVKTDAKGELIDISKTVSEMLHFAMPTTKGKYLKELFL